jgi:hypothetical protein
MKISFIPTSKFAEDCLTPPLPAKKVIPEWYKKTPFLIEGLDEYAFLKSAPPVTHKGCNPFLDSLTAGYVFCLSSDLEIINEGDGNHSFYWKSNNNVITDHSKNQHPLLPDAFNGFDGVHKFHNDFIIKTPKGYSTHFTHPLNQHDLPFRTLSGTVDTDTYMQPVHFPFQLLTTDKELTILERGTPVCQFIPFKRNNWKHTIEKFDEALIEKEIFKYNSRIYRAYKSLHWVKKRFD